MTRAALTRCLLLHFAGIVLLLTGCSVAPFRHEAWPDPTVVARAVSQEGSYYVVRASVPSRAEAEKIFGIPVYDSDIQPVWLEITNRSDNRARVSLTSVDPDYYSPLEVAYMHRKRFSKEGWQDMERYFYRLGLPRQIAAGDTASGFVFTHAAIGTKAFNVDVFDTGAAARDNYERFTFFLEVPGFVPDHAEIDFATLYEPRERREVDTEGLRAVLRELPCCSTDSTGQKDGRPVTVVFVAEGLTLLKALLSADWAESSYQRDEEYREGMQYLFGRPPDSIFRKARDRTTERIELSVWLSPYTVDGVPVWFAQTRHAIGRRYKIGEFLRGARLDPDLADGRNYVLQDFWYTQALQHWAWSDSLPQVSPDEPRMDFKGNPWFMRTPYRVVIWVAREPTAMADATEIRWLEAGAYAGDEP